MPKVNKNNWAKTMENVVLQLKLLKDMRGALLVHVTKVAYISPGYGTYHDCQGSIVESK